ncbi:MAG: hypothetical protein NVS3B18_04960 [Candidatus Dormibacteria bacterium]
MIVQHAFTVNAPSERVFAALLDLRTSLACLPGTRLDRIEGHTASGRVRAPLGSGAVPYRGTLRVVDSDPEARSLRAVLQGTAERGAGMASAQIELRLRESSGLTTASLRGELQVDGHAPEGDADALQRTVAALLRRFGRCLETAMARGAEPGARVDADERLEETIAALTQLERATITPRPAPGRSPAGALSAGPAATAQPPPSASAATGQSQPDPPVAGRVEVVTTRPVPVPRDPTWRTRAGDRLDELPWVLPTALLSALMLWLLTRRQA